MESDILYQMSIVSILIIIKIILTIFIQPSQVNYSFIKKSANISEKAPINYNIMLYKCDFCYGYFLTKDELSTHLMIYHPQEYEDIKILTEELKDKYFKRLLSNYDN